MKIATFNICGWNSAIKKGLANFIKNSGIDIIALQELRTLKITKPLELIGYFSIFNPARFHGTAVISRKKAKGIKKEIGHKRFDGEGRFIQLEFEDFIFLNVYMPHGRRDKKELPYKLEVYDFLIEYLSELLSKQKPIILAGDFNVAHREIDLAKPEENRNNIMFTEEEKERIDKIVRMGFIDTFRKLNKEEKGYTWWLRAFNSKERNIGWRIDYIFVSGELESNLKNCFVPNLAISDHCPVVLEVEF